MSRKLILKNFYQTPEMTLTRKKTDLLEFTREQLMSWLADQGIAAYRADQIQKWIYLRQADRFDLMTDYPKISGSCCLSILRSDGWKPNRSKLPGTDPANFFLNSMTANRLKVS